MPVRSLFLAVWFTCMASLATGSEKLFLDWNNFGPDREFILSDRVLGNDIAARRDPTSHILVGRYDLNGDGRIELVVGFKTINYCGRGEDDVYCRARIYESVGNTWRLIGDMYTHLAELGDGRLYILGEDEYHNGWRILRYGDFRYCWVTDIRKAGRTTKPEQLPGYFGVVPKEKPCPP